MEIGPIIVLGITLLFGVFMYFIVVRSNKKNKLLMDSLKEVDIPEKQIKEDEIKSNLSIEELEKKSTEDKKVKDKTWEQSRIGLFIFILPHFVFEQVLFELYGSFGSNVIMVPVIVNFYITRYFIKGQIFDENKTINNPILHGLGISIIVFSIRLLLGVLLSLSVS